MVAVVEVCVEYGYDRRKDRRLQIERMQVSSIAARRKRCAAEAVVHDADFDALFALFNKGIEDLSPHNAGKDRKIFHKDEFFCSFHRPYHFGKGGFPALIIRDVAMRIRQKKCGIFQIRYDIAYFRIWIFFFFVYEINNFLRGVFIRTGNLLLHFARQRLIVH